MLEKASKGNESLGTEWKWRYLIFNPAENYMQCGKQIGKKQKQIYQLTHVFKNGVPKCHFHSQCNETAKNYILKFKTGKSHGLMKINSDNSDIRKMEVFCYKNRSISNGSWLHNS